MRRVFLAACIMTGTNIGDVPSKPSPKEHWIMPLEGLIRPLSPSTKLWLGLWSDGKGGTRVILTEAPSLRLQRMFRRVLDDLGTWKFQYREPVLYQTNDLADILIPNPPWKYYGRYFAGPNFVLVDKKLTSPMTDSELRVLLAHEVGHCIDNQTQRVGHWAFKEPYEYDTQEFADYIARLIVGSDEVAAFKKKYVTASIR